MKRMRGPAPLASALPDEVVEEILARLPVRSLLRFRCVSRSWRDTIKSPAFHTLHSERAGCRGLMLFIKPPGHYQPFYGCQPNGGSGTVEEIMDPCLALPQGDYLPEGQIFPVAKSCHGLVLLRSHEYDTHYVWNPSTREMVTLPDRIPFKTAGCKPRTRPLPCYGLGYCSMTNQYKVVRLYHLPAPANSTVCEVLTLGKSAYWRPAAMEPPLFRPAESYDQRGAVLCNGNLHFIGEGEDTVITTFNVTHETFGTLMPPPELDWYDFMLTELDGYLCAYHSTNLCHPEQTYSLWFVREGRWEKLCCIDWGTMPEATRESLRSSWFAPLGMYHDNGSGEPKKIIFGTGSCKVFAMDPNNGVLELTFSLYDTHIEGIFPTTWLTISPTMGLFEESIASVGRTSSEIIQLSPSLRVWREVLSRLPAHMVGRLNQVSKEWRAMIKDGSFVKEHLCQANQNKIPQVMLTDGRPERFKLMEQFINASAAPPLIDVSSIVVCSKPCHGLNAGSFTSYDFVCNPVTDYYKAIPFDVDGMELSGSYLHEDIAWREVNDCTEKPMFSGRFGLGYDEQAGMHVLVRIEYTERNLTAQTYKLECRIRYISDMLWEHVDPPPRPVADMPPAYANGKLYWMVDAELEQVTSAHEIILLDVASHIFEVLQGPPCAHDNRILVELKEVLCVASSHHATGIMEIWAMENFGSWSMKYYIELTRFMPEYSTRLTTPLAVDTRDGRILLSTGRSLGYYDPKTAELETIYRLGGHFEGKKFVPILFQESLVRPCDQIYLYK